MHKLREYLLTKQWYRWYAVGVLALVYASSHVDRQIMAILLEPIKTELRASDTQMGFLIGPAFAIFYATLGIPIAMLADRSNRRNIIATATMVWSAMTALCGYAGSFIQLAFSRVMVAVGEAGSTPPSLSIISDLFPPSTRATAIGVFSVGVNLGVLTAYLAGGWLADQVGWRMTFVVVGLPGVLIAALVYFTVSEPVRGASEAIDRPPEPGSAPGFMSVARHMWRVRSIRHVVTGTSISTLVSMGFTLWLPSFFIRSHGLSPTETGLLLAFMVGVVGGLGTYASGRLADRLARYDVRWRSWIMAAAKIGYLPFLLGMLWVDELWLALLLYTVPAFFSAFHSAPTIGIIQSLVSVRSRALASSILLFVVQMIGLGLGPQLVGIMSDYLRASYGHESLRISLLILSFVNLWAGLHYIIAANTITEDFSNTPGSASGQVDPTKVPPAAVAP